MESVWYGVAKVSKSPLHAGGCTALRKKNTTKTFYFLLQRNVTSKTNVLLQQDQRERPSCQRSNSPEQRKGKKKTSFF